MFSVSPAEIATIAVIALLVFGPQRLPEMARRIGTIARELSKAAQELKSGLEQELEETKAPLDDVRRRLGSTITEALEEPSPRPAPEPADQVGEDTEEQEQ